VNVVNARYGRDRRLGSDRQATAEDAANPEGAPAHLGWSLLAVAGGQVPAGHARRGEESAGALVCLAFS